LERPALFVDHHAPEAEAGVGQIVVSGFGETPTPSTSALMRRLLPDAPAWLAAVGACGDYGDAGLQLPECQPSEGEKLVKTHVKKLVSLVNAPRRLPNDPAKPIEPHPAVRTALALLVEHDSPKAALADERIAELDDAKKQYRAGFDAVIKTAPKVGDEVALIRFSSPYQVHPLVAQTWLRRLPGKAVLAANDDYLPGRVNFALRGGDGRDLRQLLKDALPDQRGEYAHGHPGATGGSLTFEEFNNLLAALGLA
jgi:single-stranded-DNA-specific exonuclease